MIKEQPVVDVYSLDLLGTFVFALYGANVALNKQLNLFGISVGGISVRRAKEQRKEEESLMKGLEKRDRRRGMDVG